MADVGQELILGMVCPHGLISFILGLDGGLAQGAGVFQQLQAHGVQRLFQLTQFVTPLWGLAAEPQRFNQCVQVKPGGVVGNRFQVTGKGEPNNDQKPESAQHHDHRLEQQCEQRPVHQLVVDGFHRRRHRQGAHGFRVVEGRAIEHQGEGLADHPAIRIGTRVELLASGCDHPGMLDNRNGAHVI